MELIDQAIYIMDQIGLTDVLRVAGVVVVAMFLYHRFVDRS